MTCHLGSPVLSCRASQGALWLVSPTLAYRLSRQSLRMGGVSDSKGICIQSNVPNTNTHLADGLLVAHLCISGGKVAVDSEDQILKGPCSRGSSESGGIYLESRFLRQGVSSVLSLFLGSLLDLDVNTQDLKILLIQLRISTKTHIENTRNALWVEYLSLGA